MNLRGKWADSPQHAIRVNVTSAQGKQNKNRRDFSPMTFVEGGYEGFSNFEAYWQSGKVFENVDTKRFKHFGKRSMKKLVLKEGILVAKERKSYVLNLIESLWTMYQVVKKYMFLDILNMSRKRK